MDFRILCIFFFTALLSYSEECEESFDETRCQFNLICTDTPNFDWTILSFNHYQRSQCLGKYFYQGYNLYPVHLTFRDTSIDDLRPVPKDFSQGVISAVYSLDISQNGYVYTPVIRSMENLEILDLSNNELSKAVLSNDNDLNKLRELDLSYNTINSIEIHNSRYPYITLEKINLAHNYLQKIPDAVFDQFDRLQTLDLSHNFIEDLNKFTFEGVKNLLYLNLTNNRLTGLGSSLFRFSKLRLLNLSGNRIKDVRMSDFEMLNTLEVLDLSSNFINTIDFAVFHDMVSLHSLDLSFNELTIASKDVFVNLQSLRSIDLSRNKLKSLPKGLFKNKTIYTFSISDNLLEGSLAKGMFDGVMVTTLDLSNQLLTDIQDYAFDDLIRLNTLLLNNNKIKSLSTMCFKTLIRLEQLDLSHNQLVSIDFNKDDLGSLRSLLLSNNQLTQIKHEHFQHLSSLEYLNLSGNNISRLEPGSFKVLNNLLNLGVSGNPLFGTLETDTFDGLVLLPSLDISFTLMVTIQNASFNAMNELKDLNMSHSKIKELQYNAFVNTGYILSLDLSYNKLENFIVNMTDLVGLNSLLLNNNLLKSVYTTSLQGLSRLTKLNLAYNVIENIQKEAFNDLLELRNLDVSYNEKLSFSDSLLENVNNLFSLVLSGVKTDFHFSKMNSTELSEVMISNAGIHNISLLNLKILKRLNTLVLSYNNVTKLEVGAFSHVKTLTHLDLSYNKIYFIQAGVFKDTGNLMSLNISHNCLSEIGYGIFRGLYYLNALDVSYNNLQDLRSERFYEIKSLTTLIVDHNQIASISGLDVVGTQLTKLSIGDNPLPCHVIVKLIKTGVVSEITAIRLDEHNGDNIDGITCNKNQEKEQFKPTSTNNNNEKNDVLLDIRNILFNISNKNTKEIIDENKYLQNVTNVIEKINEKNGVLLEIRNILFNISNKNTVQVIDEYKYLQNMTNAIEKANTINDMKFSNLANISSRVIDLNNVTHILLKEILKSSNKATVGTTTFVPLINDNKTADIISYINKMRNQLDKSILDEKQNIMNELEKKLSMVHHQTESFPTSPSNEKFVATNEGTKSLFTETCVALILIILVGFVLFKFYKSRMFIRNRFSISTRELPGSIENSAL